MNNEKRLIAKELVQIAKALTARNTSEAELESDLLKLLEKHIDGFGGPGPTDYKDAYKKLQFIIDLCKKEHDSIKAKELK